MALLGIDRATVIPHPAYSPLSPCALYIARNVPPKLALGRGFSPGILGRSSSSVCIALFTVSAGKSARLNAAPAQAPDSADSQGRSLTVGVVRKEGSSFRRRSTNNRATNSFVVNHAAPPPVSRIRVPVCPSHIPRRPVLRITDIRTDIGPGNGMAAPLADSAGVTSICTCILHLTSSMGVLNDGRTD